MTKYLWPVATSTLVALLGAALMIWPFAAHTNAGGWTHATTTDFWTGVGVVVIGVLMLLGWYGGLKQEMMARGLITVPEPEPEAAPTAPAPAGEDLDRLLRPLAESVLRDLTQQLAAKDGRPGGGNIA